MPHSIIQTGFALGGLLSTAGELGAGHFDPMTIITSAGVCGAIAWVLLRAQMERAKRDADARDKSEGDLVALVRESVASHANTGAKITELTAAINSLIRVQSDSIGEQRKTNETTTELVETLKGRPCLCDELKKEQKKETKP